MPSKPFARAARAVAQVLYHAAVVMLVLAIVAVVVEVAGALADRLSRQATIDARRPAYAATATAIAALEDAGVWLPQIAALDADQAVARVMLKAPIAARVGQLATPVPPTATPLPTDTLVPRPLPTLMIYEDPIASGAAGGTAIPSPVPSLDRFGNSLMNIVLLGHDGELTDDGFVRTDTMIIVSINRSTNTVAMLSLPRDLYVYVPGWTMQRINVAYIHGETTGWTDGGFGLLRQTLFYNFGINVHYYAIVNLSGFKSIVDSVGGVQLTVDCAIEDLPLIGAQVPAGAYRVNDEGYYVLPVGAYDMDGAEALWYVRSRHNSSDFDRGRRQQQLLRAIYRTARDTGLLNNVIPLWNEAQQYLTTNMTLEDVLGLVPLALTIDSSRIENYRLVRTYHTVPWQAPDGSNVQIPVPDTIRELMQDFYTPPTENQLVLRQTAIHVYNASGNPGWDEVAAERLAWDGYFAVAMGDAPGGQLLDETVMIDYSGSAKGSSSPAIARVLNVRADQVSVQPTADRDAEFSVLVGRNYNSCIEQGIIAPTG